MKTPDIPPDEPQRLAALRELEVLDTPPEERFDALTRLAQRYLDVPIALVSLVDAGRQWFKSRQGLEAPETSRDISFCGHAILGPDVLYVPNALDDPRFADNPLVTGPPGIRCYAGAPLTTGDGHRVGTLCVIDTEPRRWSEADFEVLRDLAGCVERELERVRIQDSARLLSRRQAHLRAVLDTVVDGIITIDQAGTIGTVNPAAERLFGYPAAEMLGRNVRMLMPEPYASGHDGYLHRYLETGEPRVIGIGREVVGRRKDGSTFPLELAVSEMRLGEERSFVGVTRDISERKAHAAEIRLGHQLLEAVHRAQSRFIREEDAGQVFGRLLDDILEVTDSAYGFIAEVLHEEDGTPYLKTQGITNIAWDEATRRFYDENAPQGMVFRNLNTLFGAVLTSGQVVISNDPARDPRAGGLPEGHPPLTAFLGVPFLQGSEMVGMMGIANRPGGYDQALVQSLQPLFATGANIIEALRIDKARRRAEGQVLAGAVRLRTILDTVVDGIVTIGEQGSLETINPAAAALFGYETDDLLGRPFPLLLAEAERDKYLQLLARYRQTGEATILGRTVEAEGLRRDGTTFPMEFAVNEMLIDGQRLFTAVVRDISERKKMERLKSEFVSTVSHELRTPLTSIRGALGLVLGGAVGELPPKAREMLDMANRNSERLTLLIDDILDLEKIESGRIAFKLRSLDPVALARQAVESNRGYAERHGVTLSLAASKVCPRIEGDEHRLLQVFANLISNAVKFSPAGAEVEVTVACEGHWVRASVRDRGAGIPDAFRGQIFQRFAQADSSDSRKKGGTGLGLSITKSIVERHGGRIDYESAPGEGALFWFELPIPRAADEAPLAAGATADILVCEDNGDVARLLRAILAQEGLTCDIAGTAAAAKGLLGRKRYRALLLDLGLPDQDGLDLIGELRAREDTAALPIVVVSARAREGRTELGGEAIAVVDWIQKPVDRTRLGRALAQALGRGAPARILHVEDDPDVVRTVEAVLEGTASLTRAASLKEARERLATEPFDLVILDLGLPDGSGLELLDGLKGRCPVVVFSGREPPADLAGQVSAALTKSVTSNERLLTTIRQVIEAKKENGA